MTQDLEKSVADTYIIAQTDIFTAGWWWYYKSHASVSLCFIIFRLVIWIQPSILVCLCVHFRIECHFFHYMTGFFSLWGLYYPYRMVHTLLPGEFGTPLSTFELLFWPLFFFFIEFGSFFWRVCVWEFCFLCSSSASSAQWSLMLPYFCVLLKDIFKGLLWWVDPTLLLSTSFYCHSWVSSYYFIRTKTFFISNSCVWLLCMFFFCW